MNHESLSARGLWLRYGRRTVLAGLDLELAPGEVTALVGRNGAGKSSLIRACVGLVPRAKGELRVLGRDPWRKGPAVRRALGYVPDRLELPEWMKVGESLRFYERFYPSWSRDEERRLVELFELEPRAKLSNLSKGQRARHALLVALAHEPELLLLDEPFSGIDPAARREILARVIDHLRDARRTVLVASHETDALARIADRVVVLHEGRIAKDVRHEELARRFVRLELRLRIPGARWQPPQGAVWDPRGEGGVLTHTDWSAELQRALDADAQVVSSRALSSDLSDFFCAATAPERAA